MFPLTFLPTRSHDEKELMLVVDPDVHAIYEHSMNRSKTNESLCTEANIWMQRNIFCVCTVHESRKKASLLCDTTLAFSFIIHIYPFLCRFITRSAATRKQIVAKKKNSRKRKINTTGCIQIVYYQGPLFSPFLKNNV